MWGRDDTEAALSRLGSGGEQDRLSSRLVVATLWRCVSLLRPVRVHVAGLVTGCAVIGLALYRPARSRQPKR